MLAAPVGMTEKKTALTKTEHQKRPGRSGRDDRLAAAATAVPNGTNWTFRDKLCAGWQTPRVVYHVYILSSASGVLYTGVTNHLERRVTEHKRELCAGFTERYKVTRLVYFEGFGDVRDAIT